MSTTTPSYLQNFNTWLETTKNKGEDCPDHPFLKTINPDLAKEYVDQLNKRLLENLETLTNHDIQCIEQHKQQILACLELEQQTSILETNTNESTIESTRKAIDHANDIFNTKTSKQLICLNDIGIAMLTSKLTLKAKLISSREIVQTKILEHLTKELGLKLHSFKVFKKCDPAHYNHKKLNSILKEKRSIINDKKKEKTSYLKKQEKQLQGISKSLYKHHTFVVSNKEPLANKKKEEERLVKHASSLEKIKELTQESSDLKLSIKKTKIKLTKILEEEKYYLSQNSFLELIKDEAKYLSELTESTSQSCLIWNGISYKLRKVLLEIEKVDSFETEEKFKEETRLVKELDDILKSIDPIKEKIFKIKSSLEIITPHLDGISSIMRECRVR